MEIVLAKLDNLKEINDMYTKIIEVMYANNIKIWNEYYPNEVFESDIENENLYLLKDNDKIVGAFAMFPHTELEDGVEWEDEDAKAYVITRLGVNVDYLRQGIGERLVSEAIKLAKEKGAGYLRLLVCEENVPAIKLYEKCEFKKLNGIHEERIRADFSLNEYGFEMRLE